MTPQDTALALGEAEVLAFREQGFTSISQITTPQEVASLRVLYDEIIEDDSAFRLQYDGETPDGAPARIKQVFGPEFAHPELLETTYIANARRLVAQLLDIDEDDCTYGGIMLIYKPAGAGLEAPFHQDEAYWEFPGERLSHSASVWMPLDDVTVDSGCMQFVPGWHDEHVWEHTRESSSFPLRFAEPVDVSGAVPVPLSAGGATIHHCRTVHGTGANTSDRPRRAFTTIFHGPPGVRDVRLSRPWLGLP